MTHASGTATISPSITGMTIPRLLSGNEFPIPKSKSERNRKLISRVYCLCAAGAILATKSSWEGNSLVDELLFVAGVMLAAAGCLGRIWCNLFVVGYKNRELITVGPYSICRNPLYFFSAVGLLGVGLTTCTVTIPFALAASFAVYYPRIIQQEERRLKLLHGERFEVYCGSTPAFFPRWTLLQEPSLYVVHAKAFRRTLNDAIWFLWILGFIHTIGHLHTSGSLPSVLAIL